MSEMVSVPYEQVPSESLDAMIESYILRSGTDYGAEEVSLTARVAQLRKQLEKREVLLVFDAESDTCTLVAAATYSKTLRSPLLGGCPTRSSEEDLA
jgi:uncharacterized protein